MKTKMTKNRRAKSSAINRDLQAFLKDVDRLSKLPMSDKNSQGLVQDYPFDAQLLELSALYRSSRNIFLKNGGEFAAKICSVARSLSAHDLFANNIQYSPMLSEIMWFKEGGYREVADPSEKLDFFKDYSGVSLFHEQNHRIVWQNLPPAPTEQVEFCRYLNFAESVVVTLDLVLADQVGKKLSPAFERMKTIYRTGGDDEWHLKSKSEYRKYLQAVMTATYFLLELYNPKDIAKGLNHIFPNEKRLVKDAVKRSLDLSDLFIQKTNQLWQERYWQQASGKLADFHSSSAADPLYLPEDPLDFGEYEFAIADKVFDLLL